MEPSLSVMGRELYRTKHQCNSKFRKMNKYLTKFNEIYNNLLIQWKNGKSDQQISKPTLKIYFVDTIFFFNFIDAWRFLSTSPKWVKVYREDEEGGRKKNKSFKD